MNKSSTPVPAIVGVILVTIFSVICLVIFSALVLLVQSRDGALTEKSVQSVSDYYAADVRAQEILAALRSGELPDGVTYDGSGYIYSCDIDGTRSLNVRVTVDGDEYTVLEYRVSSDGKWEADTNINVWDGIS